MVVEVEVPAGSTAGSTGAARRTGFAGRARLAARIGARSPSPAPSPSPSPWSAGRCCMAARISPPPSLATPPSSSSPSLSPPPVNTQSLPPASPTPLSPPLLARLLARSHVDSVGRSRSSRSRTCASHGAPPKSPALDCMRARGAPAGQRAAHVGGKPRAAQPSFATCVAKFSV